MHPTKKFTTDGCSGRISNVWRKLFNKVSPWEGECIKHDLQYWIGGSAEDRHNADAILFNGIIKKGHPIIALCMYIAVRISGHPALPFAWHWGYGHDHKNYFRKYYDRHHDAYVLLEATCKDRNIDLSEILGDKKL